MDIIVGILLAYIIMILAHSIRWPKSKRIIELEALWERELWETRRFNICSPHYIINKNDKRNQRLTGLFYAHYGQKKTIKEKHEYIDSLIGLSWEELEKELKI